jgi:hypothetical protein
MKKFLAFCVVAALAVPAMSFAAAGGVDISWNDCVNGTNGTAAQDKNFACTATNNQTFILFLQVKPPVDVGDFIAFTGVLDLKPVTPGPLAPFWHYETGGCNRLNGVTIFDVPTASCLEGGYASFSGEDGSEASENISAYFPDYQGEPGRGKFILLDTRPSESPLPLIAKANYYAVHLQFTNRNRAIGAGADCVGCEQQGAFVFQNALLESNSSPLVDVSGADKGSDCATVNAAPLAHCGVVPVQSTTWGRVKSLFR